jgi:hypothetical protein
MTSEIESRAELSGARPGEIAELPATRLTIERVRQAFELIGPYANHRLQRLGKTGTVGLALLVFSAAMYFGTVRPLELQIQQDLATIDDSLLAATSSVEPVNDVADSIGDFINTLPARDELSGLLGDISESATQSGVALNRGDYDYVRATSGGIVDRYTLSFPVSGSYPAIRDFVDRALIAVPSLALSSVRIERETIASPTVEAELEFSIFVGAN